MTTVAMDSAQQARLQNEVQNELERREWAEPGDNVMAEYVTVLIANGSSRDRVLTEMDDLVGSDFDAQFLDWLFATASDIQRVTEAPAQPAVQHGHSATSSYQANSRMLTSALASTREDSSKRKAEMQGESANKKRLSELPAGPRAMGNLQDRMGPRPPMQMQQQNRGFNGGRQQGGMGGGFQQGFRPQQPMMPGFGFFPQQQEMMAQMMMMQSNMAQMGQMMQKMAEEKEEKEAAAPVAGYGTTAQPSITPRAVKVPHGTKLGAHSVSPITPKASSTGPVPSKPSSKALCKYSVGCSNSRCIYSHPSPVADERTGMVLSDEACENGKDCKDAECTKSHVSPAAALGGIAGPARLLCKYQNCTNPACPFRHKDAEGNPIPPPAFAAPKAKEAKPVEHAPSSDNEDGEDVEVVMTHKGLMDGALDDRKTVTVCRYGERCTRPDCKFTHPASRATPKPRGSYSARGGARHSVSSDRVASTGMNKSKKFGEKLDPSAGAFVPKPAEPEVASS